jgi:hypothetical protein
MEDQTMRDHRGYINCAVATANGFAMPYRARLVVPQDKPESAVTDLDAAAMRESLAIRLRALAEKPSAKS